MENMKRSLSDESQQDLPSWSHFKYCILKITITITITITRASASCPQLSVKQTTKPESPSKSIKHMPDILLSNTMHDSKGKYAINKGMSLQIRHLCMEAVKLDYTSQEKLGL